MSSFARQRTSALVEGLVAAVLVAVVAGLTGSTALISAAPGTPPATAPVLSAAPGSGNAGMSIFVTGTGFAHRTAVQLTWDGAGGLPTVLTSTKGDFRIPILVPAGPAGTHALQAITTTKVGKGSTAVVSTVQLAETSFVVTTAPPSPTPTATPVPSPLQTPSPTPTPTPAATPSPSPSPSPVGSPAVHGTAYQDDNRNRARDPFEQALSGQTIELRDDAGRILATRVTDANGAYDFGPLTANTYQVAFGDDAWRALRLDWVPTTTGSLAPRFTAAILGNTVLDFGWRPMVRSTNLAAPIATFTGPSGLRVETYNDAVPPEEIYAELMLGLVGPEAPVVTVRFDFNQSAQTAAGWQGTPGTYSNYAAIIYAGYDFWLDGGDQGLSHEYGHAWSYYFERIVQQESGFARYLAVRGLTGDARLGTTYQWYPAEMIAEDYRELFGSDNARLAWQMNRDIPAPDDVPGLREWFLNTFMTPPG